MPVTRLNTPYLMCRKAQLGVGLFPKGNRSNAPGTFPHMRFFASSEQSVGFQKETEEGACLNLNLREHDDKAPKCKV